jgi:hypothetical protein
MAEPLILELKGLCAGYGEIQVLWASTSMSAAARSRR